AVSQTRALHRDERLSPEALGNRRVLRQSRDQARHPRPPAEPVRPAERLAEALRRLALGQADGALLGHDDERLLLDDEPAAARLGRGDAVLGRRELAAQAVAIER